MIGEFSALTIDQRQAEYDWQWSIGIVETDIEETPRRGHPRL